MESVLLKEQKTHVLHDIASTKPHCIHAIKCEIKIICTFKIDFQEKFIHDIRYTLQIQPLLFELYLR